MLLKKWETKVVKLRDVIPQDDNPRVIDSVALNGLKASINRFGYVELIIWNKQTKHIIGGHQRFSVLLQEKVIEVPMIVVDMSPEDELAASLTMNNPAIEGEFDEPVMELMGQVEQAAPELFKAVRMDDLKATLERSMDRTVGDTDNTEEWDTECPCCGKRWKVEARDITVVKGKI